MSKRVNLNDDDWAEVTAYLDGELDGGAARSVEAKLNRDAAMRAEVDALQKTWEMLDYLPQPEPSTTFTSRTLERISVLRPVSAQPAVPGVVRYPWVFAVGWAAAVLIAASLGFTAVSLLAPRAEKAAVQTNPELFDQQLVQDLGVIENKRLYDHVDNIEFVKELAGQDLGTGEWLEAPG